MASLLPKRRVFSISIHATDVVYPSATHGPCDIGSHRRLTSRGGQGIQYPCMKGCCSKIVPRRTGAYSPLRVNQPYGVIMTDSLRLQVLSGRERRSICHTLVVGEVNSSPSLHIFSESLPPVSASGLRRFILSIDQLRWPCGGMWCLIRRGLHSKLHTRCGRFSSRALRHRTSRGYRLQLHQHNLSSGV